MSQPERGVLPAGAVRVEARFGAAFRASLFAGGWVDDEPWTPLHRDLADPVPDCGLRIEVTGQERAQMRAVVQRAAFEKSTFTDERWHAMAAGSAYDDAWSAMTLKTPPWPQRRCGRPVRAVPACSNRWEYIATIVAGATYRAAGFDDEPPVPDLRRGHAQRVPIP